jgi:hypothetical protein
MSQPNLCQLGFPASERDFFDIGFQLTPGGKCTGWRVSTHILSNIGMLRLLE